ncbi:urease accessory protein UreD [Agarivorans sp. Toyoura001]|uniref:urease accessory protein UreD n=1 Tax=unclassified Agarivorans TaxID=2636026 RepID=UPI0010F266C7|nr:urease accessory protein UreD [Agarivorans sp. Toyoura001]GDY27014.1 urease accessory protein UreD 2 [Agarivorans sp. Toyoura001]
MSQLIQTQHSKAAVPIKQGWLAKLELGFAPIANKTRLTLNKSIGPLRVQRPFHPELGAPDCCHVYLLHPPGGLVAGDTLLMNVECLEGSKVVLTTPASGKLYRSNLARQEQCQQQRFHLQDNSSLEWLPPETIIFNGAQGRLDSHFMLQGDAQLIAWEITCLGRKASDEDFDHGELMQSIKVYREQRPLLIENTRIDNAQTAANPAALAGKHVYACMLATVDKLDEQAQKQLLEELREQLACPDIGITLVRGLVILRYLGDNAETVREEFEAAWAVIRPRTLGHAAVRPRIWNT